MIDKKILAVLTVSVIAAAGAGTAVLLMFEGGDSPQGGTVTDALGREVAIPERIDTLFCTGAGSLRLISYFEAVDKVKAIEAASAPFSESTDQTYFLVNKAAFESLPRIATDAESLIAHNPDLIITASTDRNAVDTLSSRVMKPVFAIDSMLEFGEGFDRQVETVGRLIGEETRARALVDGVASLISDITSEAVSESTATAYACGMFYYGGASFLKASGDYQPFQFSKIRNVQPSAPNGQPYVITSETFLRYNPDYIFIDDVELESIKAHIESNWETYKDVVALKNLNLYSCMVYKCYNTNWENQLINAFYVASVMNGPLYSWSFEDKADAVMELFYPGSGMAYSHIAGVQGGCGKVALAL